MPTLSRSQREEMLRAMFETEAWEVAVAGAARQRERVLKQLATSNYAALTDVQRDQDLLRLYARIIENPLQFFLPPE